MYEYLFHRAHLKKPIGLCPPRAKQTLLSLSNLLYVFVELNL